MNMAPKTVTVHDVQSHLPKILAMVSEGNIIVISENDKPLAKIVPVSAQSTKRTAGLNEGKIWVSDDFDNSLPDDFWLNT
jgi:antitoxin (DNA-binding transcriptional repressor) of toxin-antitoxin stability system